MQFLLFLFLGEIRLAIFTSSEQCNDATNMDKLAFESLPPLLDSNRHFGWCTHYNSDQPPVWETNKPGHELQQLLGQNDGILGQGNRNVLVLCCGSGSDLVLLLAHYNRVVCVEICETAINKALKKIHAELPGFTDQPVRITMTDTTGAVFDKSIYPEHFHSTTCSAALAIELYTYDVLSLKASYATTKFDFIYENSCYHNFRNPTNFPGALSIYLNVLYELTEPSSRVLIVSGNTNSPAKIRYFPEVTAFELHAELGSMDSDFEILVDEGFPHECVYDFRRDANTYIRDGLPSEAVQYILDHGGTLGWSTLLRRRRRQDQQSVSSIDDWCIDNIKENTLTLTRFLQNYHLQRPFLLERSKNTNKAIREKWTLDYFIHMVGNVSVNVQTIGDLARSGLQKTKIPLSTYLRNLTDQRRYVFDRQNFFRSPQGQSLLHEYSLPFLFDIKELEDNKTNHSGHSFILSLGSIGSGIPLHYHTDAWLELVAGKKEWWLAPPGTPLAYDLRVPHPFSDDEDKHEDDGERNVSLNVCHFIQHPGQVVYVPEGWFHATRNVAEFNVGIGEQASEATPIGWFHVHNKAMETFTSGMMALQKFEGPQSKPFPPYFWQAHQQIATAKKSYPKKIALNSDLLLINAKSLLYQMRVCQYSSETQDMCTSQGVDQTVLTEHTVVATIEETLRANPLNQEAIVQRCILLLEFNWYQQREGGMGAIQRCYVMIEKLLKEEDEDNVANMARAWLTNVDATRHEDTRQKRKKEKEKEKEKKEKINIRIISLRTTTLS